MKDAPMTTGNVPRRDGRMPGAYHLLLALDDVDRESLARLSAIERTTFTDVLRRLIRAEAKRRLR